MFTFNQRLSLLLNVRQTWLGLGVVLCVALFSSQADSACVRSGSPFADANGSEIASARHIRVSDVASLYRAVNRANKEGNLSIELAPGDYRLSRPIVIRGNDVVVRGSLADRTKVGLWGAGMDGAVGHIVHVMGKRVTLAHLSMGRVSNHVVQVHAESDADGFLAHDVGFYDAGEQLVKVSYSNGGSEADNGVIEWSEFAFTAGRTHQGYSGGLGALGAQNWTIRHNVFRDIRVAEGVRGEPAAIMFRRASAGTTIVNNLIVNANAGVRLGLNDGAHGPGLIANNVIVTVGGVGISLEHAHGIVVANNSVWTQGYPNAIEYRFADSTANRIVNNLLHGAIQRREWGGSDVVSNIEFAARDWFVDVDKGDLRLSGVASSSMDKGMTMELPELALDAGCVRRPHGQGYDIGAYEFVDNDSAGGPVAGEALYASVFTLQNLPHRLFYIAAAIRADPARMILPATYAFSVLCVITGLLRLRRWRKRRFVD